MPGSRWNNSPDACLAFHWLGKGKQLRGKSFANTFSKLGRKLEAGQVVTTGLVTGIFAAQPGDEVEAIYEGLGSVSVKLL